MFMYLFLRDIGLRRLGALVGAVAFAFCGFMVAHFGHLPMVPVATWIPLLLLSLRRAYCAPGWAGWAWAIAAGLCTAMSLLAGHVQIFAYGLMAAALLWLLLLFEGRPKHNSFKRWVGGPPSAGPWSKGALARARHGYGAVQILPGIELATQSVRSSISYEEATVPRPAGDPPQPGAPTSVWQQPHELHLRRVANHRELGLLGVVTLALAAAGLALRRTRMLAFFALLAAWRSCSWPGT